MIAINIFASTNSRFVRRNACVVKEKEFSNETNRLCPLRCLRFPRRHHRVHQDSFCLHSQTWRSSVLAPCLSLFCNGFARQYL